MSVEFGKQNKTKQFLIGDRYLPFKYTEWKLKFQNNGSAEHSLCLSHFPLFFLPDSIQ